MFRLMYNGLRSGVTKFVGSYEEKPDSYKSRSISQPLCEKHNTERVAKKLLLQLGLDCDDKEGKLGSFGITYHKGSFFIDEKSKKRVVLYLTDEQSDEAEDLDSFVEETIYSEERKIKNLNSRVKRRVLKSRFSKEGKKPKNFNKDSEYIKKAQKDSVSHENYNIESESIGRSLESDNSNDGALESMDLSDQFWGSENPSDQSCESEDGGEKSCESEDGSEKSCESEDGGEKSCGKSFKSDDRNERSCKSDEVCVKYCKSDTRTRTSCEFDDHNKNSSKSAGGRNIEESNKGTHLKFRESKKIMKSDRVKEVGICQEVEGNDKVKTSKVVGQTDEGDRNETWKCVVCRSYNEKPLESISEKTVHASTYIDEHSKDIYYNKYTNLLDTLHWIIKGAYDFHRTKENLDSTKMTDLKEVSESVDSGKGSNSNDESAEQVHIDSTVKSPKSNESTKLADEPIPEKVVEDKESSEVTNTDEVIKSKLISLDGSRDPAGSVLPRGIDSVNGELLKGPIMVLDHKYMKTEAFNALDLKIRQAYDTKTRTARETNGVKEHFVPTMMRTSLTTNNAVANDPFPNQNIQNMNVAMMKKSTEELFDKLVRCETSYMTGLRGADRVLHRFSFHIGIDKVMQLDLVTSCFPMDLKKLYENLEKILYCIPKCYRLPPFRSEVINYLFALRRVREEMPKLEYVLEQKIKDIGKFVREPILITETLQRTNYKLALYEFELWSMELFPYEDLAKVCHAPSEVKLLLFRIFNEHFCYLLNLNGQITEWHLSTNVEECAVWSELWNKLDMLKNTEVLLAINNYSCAGCFRRIQKNFIILDTCNALMCLFCAAKDFLYGPKERRCPKCCKRVKHWITNRDFHTLKDMTPPQNTPSSYSGKNYAKESLFSFASMKKSFRREWKEFFIRYYQGICI